MGGQQVNNKSELQFKMSLLSIRCSSFLFFILKDWIPLKGFGTVNSACTNFIDRSLLKSLIDIKGELYSEQSIEFPPVVLFKLIISLRTYTIRSKLVFNVTKITKSKSWQVFNNYQKSDRLSEISGVKENTSISQILVEVFFYCDLKSGIKVFVNDDDYVGKLQRSPLSKEQLDAICQLCKRLGCRHVSLFKLDNQFKNILQDVSAEMIRWNIHIVQRNIKTGSLRHPEYAFLSQPSFHELQSHIKMILPLGIKKRDLKDLNEWYKCIGYNDLGVKDTHLNDQTIEV